MKRILSIVVLLAASWQLGAVPIVAGSNEGFVLLNNAGLYKEKSMGNLEWVEALTLGDKVSLTSGLVKEKLNSVERDYYKVKTASGKEGYVRASLLGVGGTLGVVSSEGTFVYSEPRDVKVTERILPRGQLVVVPKDGAVDVFVPVVGYEEAKDSPIPLSYVARTDVSVGDADVNSIILLTVAKSQKNATLKKNLLTVALNKYGNSAFLDLVNAQLAALSPATRAVVAASGSFVVGDSNVNVRDLPNEKGSKVVGTLDKGATVTVSETTSTTYTVDGVTALWYHVSKPDGWVFGSFLTPAQ